MSETSPATEHWLAAGERIALGDGFVSLLDGPADLLLLSEGRAPRFLAELPAGTTLPPRYELATALRLEPHRAIRVTAGASEDGARQWLAALHAAADATGAGTEDAPDPSTAPMGTPQDFVAMSEALLGRLIAGLAGAERAQDDAARARDLAERDRFTATLTGFAELLAGRFRRAPEGAVPTELGLAARTLAHHLRLKTVVVPEPRDDGVTDYLERFAGANKLRLRRIDKSQGLPDGEMGLLGFDGEGRPVTLTPRLQGGYWVGADGGRRHRLSVAGWAALQPELFTFHRLLPDESRTVSSILSFGLMDLKADIALMAACGLAGSLLAILPPLFSAQIANIGVHTGDLHFLAQIMVVLAAVLVAEFAFSAIQQLMDLRIQGRASLTLHAAMIDRLLRLPTSVIRGSTTLILATQMETVDKLRRSLLTYATSGLFALTNGLTAAALVASASPSAALWAIALVLLLVGITVLVGWLQFKAIYEGERMDVIVLAFAYDLIRLVPIIRAVRAERSAFAQWGQNFLAFQTRIMRSTRIANRLSILEGGWEIATLVVCFTMVAFTSASGKLDAGQAIVFVLALGRLLQAGKELSHTIAGAAKLMPMAKLARPMIEHRPEPSNAGKAVPNLAGRIEMSSVRFAYDGRAVLSDVSLTIEDGAFLSLTGPSGSGKSTLVRLLSGLDRPQSGVIALDGYDLLSLDRRQIARQIGVVMQGTHLFPGTIFDNIRGVADIDAEAAWHYAELAGLADEVRAMPMGLRTMVGDSGIGLARGQVNRLMVARALAQQPRILILDEALSALDASGQNHVLDAIARLEITRIVVSHRPSVLLRTDRLLVLDGGQIAEDGTPADVLARRSALLNAA